MKPFRIRITEYIIECINAHCTRLNTFNLDQLTAIFHIQILSTVQDKLSKYEVLSTVQNAKNVKTQQVFYFIFHFVSGPGASV